MTRLANAAGLRPAPKKPRRPARTPLSAERILQAALALLDAEGVESLSMRRLGGALQVEAMSLYNYYPSKEALLEAVQAHLLAQVPLPEEEGGPWMYQIRALTQAWRATLLAHPKALPLFVGVPVKAARAGELLARLQQVLAEAGFAPSQVVWGAEALQALVIGSLNPVAADAGHPSVAGGDEARAEAEDAFSFGVEALLYGLSALRAE